MKLQATVIFIAILSWLYFLYNELQILAHMETINVDLLLFSMPCMFFHCGILINSALIVLATLYRCGCARKREYVSFACGGVTIAIMAYTIIFPIDWTGLFIKSLEANSIAIEDANVAEISWDELYEFKESDAWYFVYVGRDNCIECRKFKPKLGKWAVNNEIFVCYYNTIKDREKEGFDDKMKTINVTSVPSMLIVGHGKVQNFSIPSEDKKLYSKLLKIKDKYGLNFPLA